MISANNSWCWPALRFPSTLFSASGNCYNKAFFFYNHGLLSPTSKKALRVHVPCILFFPSMLFVFLVLSTLSRLLLLTWEMTLTQILTLGSLWSPRIYLGSHLYNSEYNYKCMCVCPHLGWYYECRNEVLFIPVPMSDLIAIT